MSHTFVNKHRVLINMSEETERSFARKLAANNASVRNNAVIALRGWLKARSSASASACLPELELRKLWRGLFFCLWLADGPSLQNELASNISRLVHCFVGPEGVKQWLVVAARTLRNEWGKLDKYRVDKYYTLLRHVLSETLLWLANSGWKENLNAIVGETLQEALFGRNCPNGIRFHMADIFCHELKSSNVTAIKPRCLLALLDPILDGISTTGDAIYFNRAMENLVAALPTTLEFMPHVKLSVIQTRIFDLASSPSTRDRYRAEIYAVHRNVEKLTGKSSRVNPALTKRKGKGSTTAAAKRDDDSTDESDENDEMDFHRKVIAESDEVIKSKKMKSSAKRAIESFNSSPSEESGLKSKVKDSKKTNSTKLKARIKDSDAGNSKRKRVRWGNDAELSHADSVKALKSNKSKVSQQPSPSRGILSKTLNDAGIRSNEKISPSSRPRASDFF